jgi:hypothetical protein
VLIPTVEGHGGGAARVVEHAVQMPVLGPGALYQRGGISVCGDVGGYDDRGSVGSPDLAGHAFAGFLAPGGEDHAGPAAAARRAKASPVP